MFSDIIQGFAEILSPQTLLIILVGTIVGLVIGALPGLSANMGVALAVPLTFSMRPIAGIALLCAVYCAGVYGGSISAILLNIPGTISSFCTTFDGYPMAKKGRVNEALGIATAASVFGGLFSAIVLMLIAPQLARLALNFGPAEYFSVTMLGLACLASIGGEGSVVKSLIAGILGLLVSTVGMDPTSGVPRFTFGSAGLMDGISLVPAMTGMFGVLAVLQMAKAKKTLEEHSVPSVKGSVWIGWKQFRELLPTFLRGSVIGTAIGILPGVGTSVSTVLAYDIEKKCSKHPETFGTGDPAGIAAPESSNNGVTGGSLVPLLALGIPGNATSALFLGALLVHGISTGPTMFTVHSETVYALFAAFFLANVFMAPLCALLLKGIRYVLTLDERLLGGAILAFCMTGVYAINRNPSDMLVMIIFGVLAYMFSLVKIPTSPMIIGMALGSMAEKSLWQALTISGGSVSFLWTRPISAVVISVALLSFLLPFAGKFVKKLKARREG